MLRSRVALGLLFLSVIAMNAVAPTAARDLVSIFSNGAGQYGQSAGQRALLGSDAESTDGKLAIALMSLEEHGILEHHWIRAFRGPAILVTELLCTSIPFNIIYF